MGQVWRNLRENRPYWEIDVIREREREIKEGKVPINSESE